MIKKLLETPKNWLTPEECERIFEVFRKRLELGEPIPPFNTRFQGKLEGILFSVSQTFGGSPLNGTILDASAAYFNQIIRGHPFKNGNKRMAVLFTHVFLLNHGIDYELSYAEMFNFAIAVARAGESGITSEKTRDWCRVVIAKFTKLKAN